MFKRLSQALFEEVKTTAEPAPSAEGVDASEAQSGGAGAEAPPEPVDLIAQMDAETAALDQLQPPVSLAAARAEFEVRLARIIAERPASVAGKMQLLDLNGIRAQVGERWQEVAERAAAIAQQVIARRLAPTDVFAPYDETGFIILFAELNEQQARLKAAAIAREIRERLVGELGGEDSAWVKAFVAKLPEVATSGAPPDLASVEAALVRTPDLAPPPSSHATDPELQKRVGEIGISFRPTLYVPRKMMSIYDCRAQRLDALDHHHAGSHAYWHADAPMVFAIDRAVLQLAIRQVRLAAEAQPAPLVQVTLHASALLAISGGQLVDLCHGLDQPLRRHLVIEIVGANVGVGFTPHIHEAVQLVHPFCRAVIARIKPGFTDLERLARHGFVSVGMDLDDPEVSLTSGMLKIDVLPLARLAHAAKLQAYLYGIHSAEVARAARAAGFDYLNGPAIAGEVTTPAKLHAFGGTT
jgi:hypothetical protein